MATSLILKRGLGKWFNKVLLNHGVRSEEPRIRILEALYERIGETGDSHLKNRSIVFYDLHSRNIMSRGHTLVLPDLGHSDVAAIPLPILEVD